MKDIFTGIKIWVDSIFFNTLKMLFLAPMVSEKKFAETIQIIISL